jgi:hypothetical protein
MQTQILSPVETLQKIHQQGVTAANDSLVVITPEIGQYVAQGDLNIWSLPELPKATVPAAINPQLAPGTTRGSRHCIKSSDLKNVEFYRLENATALHGPVLRFLQPVTIEHPEHGDQLWPAGIVAITYQRLHALELKRNAD